MWSKDIVAVDKIVLFAVLHIPKSVESRHMEWALRTRVYVNINIWIVGGSLWMFVSIPIDSLVRSAHKKNYILHEHATNNADKKVRIE